MYIKKLFQDKAVVFSFEIFPPKPTSPIETVYKTIDSLSGLKPDYISVTYGAGGSSNDNRTTELSSFIKNTCKIESVAHLTCIGSKKEGINNILENLEKQGVKNVLALRGDIPIESPKIGDFKYASDLIGHIKDREGFGISAACYPEGHIESSSLNRDIEALQRKVDAGADYLITQLFFDNNYFYDFLNKVEQKGIKVPIQAGIMPVTNKKQINRIVSLCGVKIPSKFIKIMDKYEYDKEALRDAGIAYAMDQIVDLISSGTKGVHLYTMNNPYIATKVSEGIGSLINSLNRKSVV